MVKACLDAKVAKGEVVHVDASLILADVSWESLAERQVDEVMTENAGEEDVGKEDKVGGLGGKQAKVSRTDQDPSMATFSDNRRHEACYKQHTAVDDARGVVLDVEVTTGSVSERGMIETQVDTIRDFAGWEIATVTADADYAYAGVYGALERRGLDPVIPARRAPLRSRVPLCRFRYDARNEVVKCPRGKSLRPVRVIGRGRIFHSRTRDCAGCACRPRGRRRRL